MKKAFVIGLLVALMVAPLFAGGGSASSSSSGITKILVWSDNASEKVLRDQQVARYNATRGKEQGIEIDYEVHGTGFSDLCKIAVQAGDAAALLRPNNTDDFVEGGYLVPIEELPGGQAFVDLYKGQLIDRLHVWDGKTYTLPYNVTTYKFIINQDIFDQVGITDYPRTWPEVRELAKRITQAGNGKFFGFIVGLKSTWTITNYFLYPNALSTGVPYFDNDKLRYNFASHAPMFDAIMGIINDGSMFPGFENLDADEMRAQFGAGRVGMIGGVSFDVGVYKDQFPANFKLKVIEPMAATAGQYPYKNSVTATTLLQITAEARKEPAKTMEVFKWFYSDENAAEMYEEGFYIPFRTEAMKFVKKTPTAQGWTEFADVPQKDIILPRPDTLVRIEGRAFADDIIHMMSGGYPNLTPLQVLQALDDKYNAAVEKLDPAVLKSYNSPSGRNIRRQ